MTFKATSLRRLPLEKLVLPPEIQALGPPDAVFGLHPGRERSLWVATATLALAALLAATFIFALRGNGPFHPGIVMAVLILGGGSALGCVAYLSSLKGRVLLVYLDCLVLMDYERSRVVNTLDERALRAFHRPGRGGFAELLTEVEAMTLLEMGPEPGVTRGPASHLPPLQQHRASFPSPERPPAEPERLSNQAARNTLDDTADRPLGEEIVGDSDVGEVSRAAVERSLLESNERLSARGARPRKILAPIAFSIALCAAGYLILSVAFSVALRHAGFEKVGMDVPSAAQRATQTTELPRFVPTPLAVPSATAAGSPGFAPTPGAGGIPGATPSGTAFPGVATDPNATPNTTPAAAGAIGSGPAGAVTDTPAAPGGVPGGAAVPSGGAAMPPNQ